MPAIILWIVEKLGLKMLPSLFTKEKVKSAMTPKVLGIIASVLVAIGILLYIHHLKNEIESAQQKIELRDNQLSKIQSALDSQNKSILDLKESNKNLQTNVRSAIKQNQDLSLSYDKKIAAINKDKTPQTCEESIQYLRDKARDFK